VGKQKSAPKVTPAQRIVVLSLHNIHTNRVIHNWRIKNSKYFSRQDVRIWNSEDAALRKRRPYERIAFLVGLALARRLWSAAARRRFLLRGMSRSSTLQGHISVIPKRRRAAALQKP